MGGRGRGCQGEERAIDGVDHYNIQSMNSSKIIQRIAEMEEKTGKEAASSSLKQFFSNGNVHFSLKQQSNIIEISIQFLLLAAAPLHTLLTYLLISSHRPLINHLLSTLQAQLPLYLTLYLSILCLKILLGLSVFLEITGKKPIAGISWLTRQVLQSYSGLKQLDLGLTAFMVSVSWRQSIGLLVISVGLYLMHAVYLENYLVRKELGYIGSVKSNLIFRGLLILNYSFNIAISFIESQLLFCSFYFLFSLALISWLWRTRFTLYYHPLVAKIHSTILLATASFYLPFISHVLSPRQPTLSAEIFSFAATFGVLLISFALHSSSSSFHSITPSEVKHIDLYLSILLEKSFTSAEDEAELIGLLHLDRQGEEGEEGEEDHSQPYYDPYLKAQVNLSSICKQKQSVLRRYVKRMYLKRLKSMKRVETDLYLDYCEFLCNYDLNFQQATKMLQLASMNTVNLLETIKINRMKCILKKSSERLNGQVYDGALALESAMEWQNCLEQIRNRIDKYIRESMMVWEMMGCHEISLLEYRLLLKTSFARINTINALWKKLSTSLQINPKWAFLYAHFQHFIKNERLKLTLTPDTLLSSRPIHFSPNPQLKQLYSPLVIYDSQTCILKARYELGSLVIAKVSRQFKAIFEYEGAEIIGSPIESILNHDLQLVHERKFADWVEKGHISNENLYEVRETEVVTKTGMVLPVFKYFKSSYSMTEGLCFYCMIKVNLDPLKTGSQISSDNCFSKTSLGVAERSLHTRRLRRERPKVDLTLEKNIFVKEEMLDPVDTHALIRHFKLSSRVYLGIMVVLVVTVVGMTSANTSALISYSNQFINYMAMYRFPIILATNLIKNFMGVGNQTKVIAQINSSSLSFLADSRSPLTKVTLFDQALNPPAYYQPYYKYQFLADENQSQIDLFYMMSSTISSLYLSLPVNRTGLQFRRFNSYLKPSYDTMMNTTKYKLHEQFGAILSECIGNQSVFMGVEVGVFILFTCIMFYCVHSFIGKMRNIMEIVLDLNPTQLEAISNYWKLLHSHFAIVFAHFHSTSTLPPPSSSDAIAQLYEFKQHDRIETNKRSKKLQEDRQRLYFELKLRLLILFVSGVILGASLSLQVKMILQFKELAIFEEAGFFFLKYFPTGPEVTLGCAEKYYADRYPEQLTFQPSRYDDVLQSMYIFGNTNNYIGQVVDESSIYYTKQKNYFFSNPCRYNPAIISGLGIPMSKCESISNGTFKEGLSSFLRYGQIQGRKCIYNEVNLTASQVDDLTISGSILSGYVLDSLATWVSQFSSKIGTIQSQNYIQCLVIIASLLLIHFLLNESKVLNTLQEEYEFIKLIYRNMMPESIVQSEKVTKQKFIIEGLLNP